MEFSPEDSGGRAGVPSWLASGPPPHGGFVPPPNTSASLFASQPGAGGSLGGGIPMGLYTLPGKEELYLYGYGKQFGDKLTYTAGVSYAAGSIASGAASTSETGAAAAAGSAPKSNASFRLRVNAVLNACGKHAPELASEFGALGLFYCCFNGIATNVAGDNSANAPAAGFLAGALYKCRASRRVLASYAVASSGIFFAIDQYIRRFMQ